MYYPRKLENKLKKYIDSNEIIVLNGMRRVGKTTLYRSLFESIPSQNKVFIDMENPIDQKIFEEADYNNILSNLKVYNINQDERIYLFLDEIQAKPEITIAIKYLYDHYDVKFFLTGSSSFYLKNLFPESLAGRKFVFQLHPLDFEELLIFKGIKIDRFDNLSQISQNKNIIRHEKLKSLYEEYIQFCGFPQVVIEENYDKKKLHLADIYKSYFEKDVKNLAHFREMTKFRDLILLLLKRTGGKLDITRLSSELGISRETIYSYISFLESTYFIYLIPPFSKSVDIRVSKAKKIYFCDTGLINEYVKIDDGFLFENAVFLNLKKYCNEINYFQKSGGSEIDFILDDSIGIEVKIKGVDQDLNKLKQNTSKLNLEKSYIVTKFYDNTASFISAYDL